jgi:DNA-directed RNA polymerase subunit N
MVFIRHLKNKISMLIPIRCFTCGNVIANKYGEYSNRIKAGEDPAEVMDSLGIKRYCCRRMFVSSVETIYQVIPYYEALRRRMSEIESEID